MSIENVATLTTADRLSNRKEGDMTKPGTLYRQGDVLLRRVSADAVPNNAREVAHDNGRLVLAYGEVTGHAHVIDAPADDAVMLSVAESAIFVRLTKRASLVHEEHGAIELDTGTYEVRRQREYTRWGERRVAD